MRRGAGRRQPNAKDDAADVARVDRRSEALRLRVSGHSFRAIARLLGVSVRQAHVDFQQAVAERPLENVEELRAMGNEALEAVLEGHLSAARKGDDKSAQVVIKAVAQHAKINGYEAPKKLEMTGKDGGPLETRSTYDELLGRLARVATAAGEGSGDPKPEPGGS
jgi:hypothetical protein